MKEIIKKTLNLFNYTLSKKACSMELNKKHSYSQCGEDLIVDYIFQLRNTPMPSYMDIGAHDPFYLNNTAIFYQRGCRGVNIEANPTLFEAFDEHRPGDLNLNLGIGDRDEELDFYIMEDRTLSTFSKDEYHHMLNNGKSLLEVKKIKMSTIHSILSSANVSFPDFLNIDAEGMDMTILKSIDFSKNKPKVICVEAAQYSVTGSGLRRNELIDFLVSNDYYEYANTNLNAIMVHREFWFI